MKKFKHILIFPLLILFFANFAFAQNNRTFLSEEEILYLNSRNNTIVVYPEKNNPPFSYQSAGGNIQGLSIDYLTLIAEKLGIKINYLSPQNRNQIFTDLENKKGDVATGFTELPNRFESFIFTDSYVTVPTVIVVRKDNKNNNLDMSDLSGKRVSVVASSALFYYIQQNYPRIVLEDVTDNEVSLQKIVLGEVEAGVMDIASLSHFLSKQVLSSVKVVGSVGFDYKPSFMLPKDKYVLQSILEKGLMQISTKEREIFNDKWVSFANENKDTEGFFKKLERYFDKFSIYVAFTILVFIIVFLLVRQRYPKINFSYKYQKVHDLKDDLKELEETSHILAEELKEVRAKEEELHEKIENTLRR